MLHGISRNKGFDLLYKFCSSVHSRTCSSDMFISKLSSFTDLSTLGSNVVIFLMYVAMRGVSE